MSELNRTRTLRRQSFFPAIVLLTLALFLLPAAARAEQGPMFLIESIQVDGGGPTAARIVVAESQLNEGSTYSEPQLRDAMARIQRLPFIVATDFRLSKGSQFGRYVLLISIRQMKSLFLSSEIRTMWVDDQRYHNLPSGLEISSLTTQERTHDLTVGARRFVGSKGLLTVAAQRFENRNDRYTLSFSQYDLFGTRASLSAVVSYLEHPAGRRAGGDERYDWHHRDNLTWELIGILPLGPNDSFRGSWQQTERAAGYNEIDPATGRPRHILRSLPERRSEFFYIHDSTNDALFPTSGTRITAGAVRSKVVTTAFAAVGKRTIDELRATAEHTWRMTRAQAVTVGATGSDYDQIIRTYKMFGRYSTDLWGSERTLRDGDLRLEIVVDKTFQRVVRPPFSTESVVSVGLAHRNVWGVVRFTAEYSSGREP
jgi:hypothetical protein